MVNHLSDLPRGVRNNNPFNIRISPYNNWLGKVANNTDGSFEQFTDMTFGVRAWCKLIYNYVTKHRCSTIQSIVNRFAPPTENDSLSYVKYVRQVVGSLAVDPTSPVFLFRLASAMFSIENGRHPFADEYEYIRNGISMFLNEINKTKVKI